MRVTVYNGRMAQEDLVVVATFNDRPEAELARGALEAAGLDAMVSGDDAGALQPALGWTGSGIHLVVRAEDADAAREILNTPAKPV
jgi:hypothetical protein